MRISPGASTSVAARDHPVLRLQQDLHAQHPIFLDVNPYFTADVPALVLNDQTLLALFSLSLGQYLGVDPDNLRVGRQQGAALKRVEEVASPAAARPQPANAFEGMQR